MPKSLAPDSKLVLGIDIGGTKCAVLLGEPSGKVVRRIERSTSDGLATWPDAGETLSGMIASLCRKMSIEVSALDSVGVSCGGPLDSSTGTVHSPPNLPGWKDVPVRSFLTERLSCSNVFVENDANATAVAEHLWGAGKGVNNLAYLTCGTGIGGGLILNGRLYRGRNDLAGEIGHTVVVAGGPMCLCGKRGCLEALASGSAIGRIASEAWGLGPVSGKAVVDLAKTGNTSALKILLSSAYYLGIGISNLLQTLNLEIVIVGSLAVYAGNEYLDMVRTTVFENTWPTIAKDVKVVASGLGKRTQDLAALAVALGIEDCAPIAEQ